MWIAFSNVARYSEPARFFWATQKLAPLSPKAARPASYTGAKRRLNPTISTRSCAAASSASDWASDTLVASGFSQKTSTPAANASRVAWTCSERGVSTNRASSSSVSSNASTVG